MSLFKNKKQLFRNLIVIINLTMSCLTLSAQDGTVQNPFELKEREENLGFEKDTSATEQEELIKSDNPFEVSSQTRKEPVIEHENTTTKPEKSLDDPIIPTKPSHVWMGGIILILSVLLAIINTLHRQGLQRTFSAFSNPNMMNAQYRSGKGNNITLYLLAYTLYIASAGTFLYLLAQHFEYHIWENGILAVLICITFVAVTMFGKHVLLNILAWIMPFDKELNLYNYMISVFNHIIGIVLLPFIILAAFAPQPFSKWALIGGVGSVLIIYLYRAFRALIIGGKFISFHKFHFFLYLCAVEIAPLLILIKLLKIWE